jgi:hypothetical protein
VPLFVQFKRPLLLAPRNASSWRNCRVPPASTIRRTPLIDGAASEGTLRVVSDPTCFNSGTSFRAESAPTWSPCEGPEPKRKPSLHCERNRLYPRSDLPISVANSSWFLTPALWPSHHNVRSSPNSRLTRATNSSSLSAACVTICSSVLLARPLSAGAASGPAG